MDLTQGLRILIHQRADPPRLCAGEIMGDHAAGSENDWILTVSFFCCGLPFHRLKMCFAVRMIEFVAFVQPGCAWMVRGRARPANSKLTINTVPGNAVVIADTSLGGNT